MLGVEREVEELNGKFLLLCETGQQQVEINEKQVENSLKTADFPNDLP